MKKKIFELFVCMLLVGTSFVVTQNTVRAPQDGDYIYTVSGGVATITGYNGTGGAITIPSTLGGYPTVAIGDSAFFSCSDLTSVTIPNSVITIGDCAFCNCTSLTSVTIPNNVTIIGDGAFGSCSSLTMINVDTTNVNYASVDGVLYNKVITTLIQCPGGKVAVSIPNSVTTIEDFAFNSCTSLTSVIIGNSVTTIGYCAFGSCSDLTSVTIPNSVITIGDCAFAGCSSLISVTIANSVITIGNQAFCWCNSLTSVTIPNSVATIGNYAFDSCTSLASVIIGNSVTTIGYFAFISCFNLASITFLGLVAPITVEVHWIFLTPVEIRGHAYAASNFPPPGGVWNGLTMGAYINHSPADIYVDDDNTAGPWDGTVEHPYQHIQDGVNAANEGNTVFVYSGIYYEQVTLDGSTNKNHVTLLGENRNATIIDACGYTFALNIVNSNNEFISKFFLVNASSFGCSFTADGIGCYDNELSNCTIVDNLGDGLRLYGHDQNASNNRIINCTIYQNNGYGIRTETNNGGVSNNVIYHNNIFYNGHNAYDTESNLWYNATIMEGNYWLDYTGEDNNGDGIGDTPYNISGGSNQDLYPFMEQDGWLQPPIHSSNIYVDDDNTAGPWGGSKEHPYQHIQDGVDAVAEDGTVFVFDGVYYENVILSKDNIHLIGENKNTTIIDANGIGNTLYIAYHKNNHISNFTIQNAGENGVYIYAYSTTHSWLSENNTLKDCIITDNSGNGVYIHPTGYGCRIHDTKILNCVISQNGENGIYLHAQGNHCSIGYSTNITLISDCIIKNNSVDGIRMFAEDHHSFISFTKVINCTIAGNNGYGINIMLTPDCWNDNHIIYHNNFINNGQNAFDSYNSSVNKWYSVIVLEGNYWSDYIGIDSNGDGIGDTPYNISDGSNQDLYPLMHLCGSQKTTTMGITPSLSEILPGQTFNVTIYIDPTVGIGGWEIFTLSYTQEALNATLVSPGPFWTAFFDPGIINNGNGTITGIQSFTSGPYPDDNHTACVIQFTAVHPGRCHFNLSRVVVTDSAFNPLEVITSPATVIITSSPLVTNEYPINTTTNVERPPTHLSAQVNVTESGSMDIFIRWKNHQGTWITLESFHMAGNNTYSYNPIGNEWIWGNTIYTWSINATEGTYWTNTTYSYTTKGNRYDINNDNIVNFQDAGLVWIHRTTLVPYDGLYDVNQDGNVNFQDAGLTWIHRD